VSSLCSLNHRPPATRSVPLPRPERPVSASMITSSLVAGQQCVPQQGGGTQTPPLCDSEALQHLRSGYGPERPSVTFPRAAESARTTQRGGSCPPAAPSGSVMILPSPPVLL
jgi:hypothetical protein